MALTIPVKGNVNISDIYVQVTCRECQHTYSVQMDKPQKQKNCRCGKGTFSFLVRPYPNKVVIAVGFIGYNGHPEIIEPNAYSIGE